MLLGQGKWVEKTFKGTEHDGAKLWCGFAAIWKKALLVYDGIMKKITSF